MSQQFCLKWNNHMNNMMDVFKNLLSTEAMVDVTLACDGLSLKAHKMVLSACSPFFQSLFLENPCKHPIVILKDMKYAELKAIIEFMYHGEVNVAQDQLSALMKTAETLRVKGLAEVTNENQSNQDDASSHKSVPRTDTPPPKRRKGRTRKRSSSDRSDDEASEPKIRQPESPEIEELSADIDTNSQYSNVHTSVPIQTSSHTPNSFHKSSHQELSIDQTANDSYAVEEKFTVEPSKLLEQTLTSDDVPRRSGRSSVQPNIEMQKQPRSSTDHSSTSLVPTSNALLNQPESPPDIKPELLELDPPTSPVAGPSHSADENSMMMYMDQSSMSGPSNYQDNSALVPSDSQPQGRQNETKYSDKQIFSLLQNITAEIRDVRKAFYDVLCGKTSMLHMPGNSLLPLQTASAHASENVSPLPLQIGSSDGSENSSPLPVQTVSSDVSENSSPLPVQTVSENSSPLPVQTVSENSSSLLYQTASSRVSENSSPLLRQALSLCVSENSSQLPQALASHVSENSSQLPQALASHVSENSSQLCQTLPSRVSENSSSLLRQASTSRVSKNSSQLRQSSTSRVSENSSPLLPQVLISRISENSSPLLRQASTSHVSENSSPLCQTLPSRFSEKNLLLYLQTLPENGQLPVLSSQDSVKCPSLPLQTAKDANEFEAYLSKKNNFARLLKKMSKKSGDCARDYIKEMLQSIISNELSVEYNWMGKNDKMSLSDLRHIIKLIIDAVKERFQNYSEVNVLRFIKYWIYHGSERVYGRNKQNISSLPKQLSLQKQSKIKEMRLDRKLSLKKNSCILKKSNAKNAKLDKKLAGNSSLLKKSNVKNVKLDKKLAGNSSLLKKSKVKNSKLVKKVNS